MKRLDNRGQVLVLFILFLPIMLGVMVLVIDIGKYIAIKCEINNINNMVMEYGLDNYKNIDVENELMELVILNNANLRKIDVKYEDNYIYIDLYYEDSSMLGNIFNIDIFGVRSYYRGNVVDKKIERIK